MSAYYTEQEAADKAQISVDDLDLYRLRCILPFTHRGGAVLYRAAEVDDLAQSLRLPGLAWARIASLEQRVRDLEHEAALRSRYSTHPRRPAPTQEEMRARRKEYDSEKPPWGIEQILSAASYALRTSTEEAARARAWFGGGEALREVRDRLRRMERHLREDLRADFPGVYAVLDDAHTHIEAVLLRSLRSPGDSEISR